jgi:hypothetical protein
VVQRLIGISDIDAALDNPGRDELRRLAMSFQMQ